MLSNQIAIDRKSVAATIDHVELHIVQPLFEGDAPIRGATYTMAQLGLWRGKIFDAMVAAKNPAAAFNPGEHCRFCPVKPACPALLGLVQQMPSPPVFNGLSVEKISEWLAKADTIEMWIAALREHAHGTINCGTPIPGWRLQDKRATRKWTDERAVQSEAKGAGIVVTARKLMSPTQVEKKFRGIPVVLQPFVDQTPSGQNLVRDESYVATDTEQPALDKALLNLQYRV
jgi:hypothetical protein